MKNYLILHSIISGSGMARWILEYSKTANKPIPFDWKDHGSLRI